MTGEHVAELTVGALMAIAYGDAWRRERKQRRRDAWRHVAEPPSDVRKRNGQDDTDDGRLARAIDTVRSGRWAS